MSDGGAEGLRWPQGHLTAGVLPDGLFEASQEGTPQGGPLSPLLSNLVLDELDRELERRGHRFVRYADDCNVYVRSEQAGPRVMASLTRFIERRLKLQVNTQKSAVARPWQRSLLGFTVTEEIQPRRRIAEKALARFKDRVRDLTRRHRGVSLQRMITDLNPLLRGWAGYFGFTQLRELESLDAGHDGACVASSGSSGRRAADAIENSSVSRSRRRRPVRPSSAQRDRGD